MLVNERVYNRLCSGSLGIPNTNVEKYHICQQLHMLDGNFLHLIYHANSSYATLVLYRWRKPAWESTWLTLAGNFFFISDRTQIFRVQLSTEINNPHQKSKGEKGNSRREKREQLECLTSFSDRNDYKHRSRVLLKRKTSNKHLVCMLLDVRDILAQYLFI
jgi:hypothetical protein